MIEVVAAVAVVVVVVATAAGGGDPTPSVQRVRERAWQRYRPGEAPLTSRQRDLHEVADQYQ